VPWKIGDARCRTLKKCFPDRRLRIFDRFSLTGRWKVSKIILRQWRGVVAGFALPPGGAERNRDMLSSWENARIDDSTLA